MSNVFETLSKVDVSKHIESKNGLSYLSWAWGWNYVKGLYQKSSYKVKKSKAIINGCENELNYFTDGKTAWVEVEVTVEGETEEMYLPIMDYRNRSIQLENITSFDVNKSIQRCLAKNIAINFGLGISLYANEDLPESQEDKSKDEKVIKATSNQIGLIKMSYDDENIEKIKKYYKVKDLSELTVTQASQALEKKGVKNV